MAGMAFHFSSGKSSTRATCWIPALLTMMSTWPNSGPGGVDHVRMASGWLATAFSGMVTRRRFPNQE